MLDFHKFMRMRGIKKMLKKFEKKCCDMKKSIIFAVGSLIKNVSKSMTVFDKEF